MSLPAQTYCPQLYRSRLLLSGMAIFFMLALASTLVMLPLVSKQNKNVLLNAVEEEAGGSNTNINEEHKSGKTIHANFIDFAQFMQTAQSIRAQYEIPLSVDIRSTDHTRRIIQPPEC